MTARNLALALPLVSGLALFGASLVALAAQRSPGRPAVADRWRLYVAAESEVIGYGIDASGRARKICHLSVGGYVPGGIGVDKFGFLMVPLGTNNINLYLGPQMCGPIAGQITVDHYGYENDVASLNANKGKIVAAALPPFSLTGDVAVCYVGDASCTVLDTHRHIVGAAAVAIDSAGDCWAIVETLSGRRGSLLEYFKGCRQTGVRASGWVNPTGGGLDVDERGNLLSISAAYRGSSLYVYSGCKPQCVRIGGPFSLAHFPAFGRISRDNALFATTGQGFVDVYDYNPTAVRPKFSFSTGFQNTTGIAFSPGR
jgi:hypothetical protein